MKKKMEGKNFSTSLLNGCFYRKQASEAAEQKPHLFEYFYNAELFFRDAGNCLQFG